jgi:acyl-CoA dehydrogenase
MNFEFDSTTTEYMARLSEYMELEIYPAEAEFGAALAASAPPARIRPLFERLKSEARRRGLWNLFLPDEKLGAGLTTLQYAPLAELSGRSPYLAPEAMNCAAPDTGNMEILHLFGTPEQQERWLTPLLDGQIRSAFAMTEPGVASSDATNIETSIQRDSDDFVINGSKWWISGALDDRCRVLIVMGKTDPAAERHRQQSMVLVPIDTPGVTVRRPMQVFGYDDMLVGGHAELELRDVRVPAHNILHEVGGGFAIAQARLGPGRVHHCMRLLGMAQRAYEMMCERVNHRSAFGAPLSSHGVILDWVAEAKVRIDQARLLVLQTAWLIDARGAKAAHADIQAIKIVAPEMACWVLDHAIQAFGSAGLSQDTPLASWWALARSLRFADGPDEVHRSALGRSQARLYADRRTSA